MATRYLVPAMLILVGLIHLLPLSGVLGSERLASLYGLSFSEPNLAILMRHRAVLFGLLGVLLDTCCVSPDVADRRVHRWPDQRRFISRGSLQRSAATTSKSGEL